MRWTLKMLDKCTAYFATDILVDSPSQRIFLIKEGVLSPDRSTVLCSGSICGVDTRRFCPSSSSRGHVRTELLSSDDAIVCLYLGRLNRDKGLFDLALAFSSIAKQFPRAELWLVGPDEEHIFQDICSTLEDCVSRVRRVDYTPCPERFMQAADFFCLPSYREGFGSSVIEAGACGLPSLVSRIYGLSDAVIDGETGWTYEVGNISDLSSQLEFIFSNPSEIHGKGDAARQFAVQFFDQHLITSAMNDFYHSLLHETLS